MATADQVKALYRAQFPAFLRFAYRELHPSQPLIDTWHIDVVAEHLMRVAGVTRIKCQTDKGRQHRSSSDRADNKAYFRFAASISSHTCFSRYLPTVTFSSSMSLDTHRRPSRRQATAVVNPPPNGSITS